MPIDKIIAAGTTLAVLLGEYLKSRQQPDEKKTDAGKQLADVQTDLRKQADFIAKLNEQVEALAALAAKQQASLRRLKLVTGFALLILAILIAILFWKV